MVYRTIKGTPSLSAMTQGIMSVFLFFILSKWCLRFKCGFYPTGICGLTWPNQVFVETRLNEFPQLSKLPNRWPLAYKVRGREKNEKDSGRCRQKAYSGKKSMWGKCIHSPLVWMQLHHIVQRNKKSSVCFCFVLFFYAHWTPPKEWDTHLWRKTRELSMVPKAGSTKDSSRPPFLFYYFFQAESTDLSHNHVA